MGYYEVFLVIKPIGYVTEPISYATKPISYGTDLECMLLLSGISIRNISFDNPVMHIIFL